MTDERDRPPRRPRDTHHSALRRPRLLRRTWPGDAPLCAGVVAERGLAALSLAVVAAGGAAAAWFSSTALGGGHHTLAVVSPPPAPHKVTLVAYVGQQPQGFHIGTVPQGYGLDLQASTAYTVVLAPAGTPTRTPTALPASWWSQRKTPARTIPCPRWATSRRASAAYRVAWAMTGRQPRSGGRSAASCSTCSAGTASGSPTVSSSASPAPSRRRPSCSCRRAEPAGIHSAKGDPANVLRANY